MNNGAILRQTPALLISRWLIDPNGNVYQRDAKDENIIILPRLIAPFKREGGGGCKWEFECLRSWGKSISEAPVWFCSCFIELIKGYGVFNIAHLNNLVRGLNMLAVDHKKQGMLQYLMARNQWVKSVVLALNSDPGTGQTPRIHQNSITQNPSEQLPRTAKNGPLLFFRRP